MGYEEMIKDANELARVLIKKKSRKVLGVYYAIWGFYALTLGSIYSVLSSLNINITFLDWLTPFIVLVPFAYLSVKLSKGINAEYLRLINSENNSKDYGYVIWILLTVMLLISSALVFQFGLNVAYYILSSYAYMAFVAYSLYRFLYSKYRFVDPRYYDILAIFSILLVPLGVISQAFYFIFIITWFYASINSLLEVSTVE